jgi:hypothetical protein
MKLVGHKLKFGQQVCVGDRLLIETIAIILAGPN